MNALRVIADDLTGACDVGAELAAAGLSVRVRVTVGDDGPTDPPGTIRVSNTQSRSVPATVAYARVLEAVRARPAAVVLKKIDTALRGHLGAELDAALDGSGARQAFLLPAIPAAGRVTRGGRQWFADRVLSATEFADDPEGAGAEASVPAVLARESARKSAVVPRSVVAAGGLAERARALAREDVAFVVVDAESERDVDAAVAALLALPRPLCLAGSTALARAAAPHVDAGRGLASDREPEGVPAAWRSCGRARPVLIVCGSLHTTAHAQVTALERAALVEAVTLATADAIGTRAAVSAARRALAAGRSVALTVPRPTGRPEVTARHATERALAGVARELAGTVGTFATLVVVGGETSHAVLTRLGATTLALYGRFAPLVAVGEVLDGAASGAKLVTKGGSGGDAETLVALMESLADARPSPGGRVAG